MKLILSLCLVGAAVDFSHAAPKPRHRSVAALWTRVSAWLNAEPVYQAQPVAAVAAVRGGIPTENGQDLDQFLLDQAEPLRRKLLTPAGGERDRSTLRKIYGALALSQFVQTTEMKNPATNAESIEGIKKWRKAHPSLPSGLSAALASRDLGGTALVKAGWGGYCRSLAAPSGTPGEAPGFTADEETAKLDELLKGVRDAWSGKKLRPDDEARAHLLQAQLLTALAQAPLARRKESAGGGSSSAQAKPIKLTTAPAAPAPAGAAGPEFSARAIYDKASPSVVLIMGSDPDGGGELGSGSLIGGGKILTNAHVVIRDSTGKPWPRIHVYFKPAKLTGDAKKDLVDPAEATVKSWDRALDLAVIEIPSDGGRGALSLADPESVSIGDRVAAIGHPEQGGLWTLTTGVVSTVVANLGGVEGKKAFQTDASINRGNSGGPLLNAGGDIVGVNTLMSRKAADGLAITAVNFAVRSDVVSSWLAGIGSAVAYAAPAAAPAPTAAETASRPVERPAAPAPRKETITESKPFNREDLIAREIAEMEDIEKEMQGEVRRVRK